MMPTSLGHRLRLLRAERQLSLRQAAARAGVVKETISDIERGVTHPQDVTLAKLAHAYDVPIEDLLEEPALAGKAKAPREAGPSEAELQRSSLDQVRDTFAPLADGLNHYCARWEEKLPNLQGTAEEVEDFFLDFQDLRAIILGVLGDELYAVAKALDLGTRYGDESGLPRDARLGFIRGEAEQHSLMHEVIKRYGAVGHALAESVRDEKKAERMRQVLAEAGV